MKPIKLILAITVIGLFCFTSPAQSFLTNGLVAYYPFNGNANDASGNGNNGTAIQAALVADRFGNPNQAYSFNGTNSYIGFSNVPMSQIDNWSLVVWMNPATLYQTGIAVGFGYDDGVTGNGYSLGLNNNQLLAMFGGLGYINNGFTFPATNQWYQIVMLRDSGVTRVYVNGVSAGGGDTTAPLTPTAFRLGSNTGVRFFNGAIDDVRLYNRALSSNEVAQLYGYEAPPPQTFLTNGLVAYYPFSGNANDASGNGNHGTAINGVSYISSPLGAAASFNGNSQYVSLPNTISNFQDLSVTFWVNTSDSNPNGFPYGEFLISRDIAGYAFDWNICLGQGRKIEFLTDADDLMTPQDIASNDWVQVSCVADSVNQVKTLFVNGQFVASTNWSPNPFANNAVPILIGAASADTAAHAFFTGGLTDIRIYNHALTTNEVQAIYGLENPDQCTPPLAGLISWWPGAGNTLDLAGTNSGSTVGTLYYTNGEVGQAFGFDGSGYVSIPDAPALNPPGAFSIEGWIYPTQDGDQKILSKWGDQDAYDNNRSYSFGTITGLGLSFNISDFANQWNSDFQWFMVPNVLALNAWNHVAATYDSVTGIRCIYVNGFKVATHTNVPVAVYASITPVTIGAWLRAPGSSQDHFQGSIDEVSFYGRALSGIELAAIYQAGSAGKCAGGPFPPQITMPPLNQTAVQGSNIVLSVTAAGTGPFSYQWTFNGKNLSGAINATLVLDNLHPYQSGNYAVIITTPYGKITSPPATVKVTAQTILIYKYTGTDKITTDGQSLTVAYSGQFFFIPDTTNGLFVGWATVKGKKQYWVNPLFDYLLITVPGAAKQTFTLLGQARQGFDSNGYPHLLMDLHKGQNSLLSVGGKKFLSFPSTLANTSTSIYPNLTTGKMTLNEATSAYTFSAAATQNANNNGQTMADLVNALIKLLVAQGYQK